MDFKIDKEFQQHLRPLTKAEYQKLSVKIESEGCAPGALVVAKIGDEHILMDGHNTVKICREKKLKLCEPRVITFPNRDMALEWMEEHQQSRRNVTVEEMQKLRQERIERVAKAKQEGKSNRAIAEEEGVSEKQVREDVKQAGAEGYAPEPESGKITGKDDKSYPAHPQESVFCPRCKRVGPVRDCADCDKLRNKKPKPPKGPKKPKVGAEKFNFREFDTHFGHVARGPDKICAAYEGEKKSDEYKECVEHLRAFRRVWEKWQKRLLKIKE